jgi:hypothetical protein
MSDLMVNEAENHEAAVEHEPGEPCSGCRRMLPIRFRKSGETAAHWECTACRTPLTGILLKAQAEKSIEAIRIGRLHFDTSGAPAIPLRLQQLVKEFVESRLKNPPTDDRRKIVRVPTELEVTVLLLDNQWNPQARPLLGIGIDLTQHGLGLITTCQIEAEYAAVQIRLPSGVAQILCRVVWTKDIGHGFFNSGLHFLMRFGRNAEKQVSGVGSQVSDIDPTADN